MIGSKYYSLLRSLVAPDRPSDKSYDDLVAVLKKHFEPKPIVIAERFHFHHRAQAIGETISEYMAELRKLTTHCQSGSLFCFLCLSAHVPAPLIVTVYIYVVHSDVMS